MFFYCYQHDNQNTGSFILMWCLLHSHKLRWDQQAEGAREYGAEEDVWAKEGCGKRGVQKTTLMRNLMIYTAHQILFK